MASKPEELPPPPLPRCRPALPGFPCLPPPTTHSTSEVYLNPQFSIKTEVLGGGGCSGRGRD